MTPNETLRKVAEHWGERTREAIALALAPVPAVPTTRQQERAINRAEAFSGDAYWYARLAFAAAKAVRS